MRFTLVALLIFALPAHAQDTSALYDLRIIGLKLGEMRIVGRVAGGTYQAKSQFYTTGATGALSRARFTAQSNGRATSRGLRPQSYAEDIDTGKRKRTTGWTPPVTRGVPLR